MTKDTSKIIACSDCFEDHGLQIDAIKIGIRSDEACPICNSKNGKKLNVNQVEALAYNYYVLGSFIRCEYGAAPCVKFNTHQKTSIGVPSWCQKDTKLISHLLGIGFFHYGPRMWMIGEVEPLKKLQKANERQKILDRIVSEYPKRTIDGSVYFYRIRKKPKRITDPSEYDSPPNTFLGSGRLDSNDLPVLYASPDIEACVHECRFTAEDELYVATLCASNELNLLDLSVLLEEDEGVTEFESLDMAVHMLFLAPSHSYEISRNIAKAACNSGYDGIIYPSYFSLLRTGSMPFQTVYGISHRMIPQYKKHEEAMSIPNLGIFGRPINDEKIDVKCINKLIMRRISYDFHFGIAEIN